MVENKINWKDTNKKRIRNRDDLEFLLCRMVDAGLMKEKYDKEKNDLVYSLEKEGKEKVKELLKTDKIARIYLIELNMRYQGKDFYESLLIVARTMKEEFGINLFQDIVDAVEEGIVEGITIEDKELFVGTYNKI